MKMVKVVNVGGAFARKEDYEYEGKKYEADLQNGDKIKILSEGEIVSGQFGEQTVFKIETRNGEKNYPMNQKSINILIDSFGEDSKKWIDKEVDVLTLKGVYAGKKGIASYLVTDGWILDDYGDLVKSQEGIDETKNEDYPDDEINPDDIPFD